eukprot:944913-Pleurochrysis_carterae.AAC.1
MYLMIQLFFAVLSQKFTADLLARGIARDDIAGYNWFNHVFRTSPELADIEIASGKENFGQCSLCVEVEEEIRQARNSPLAQL